MKRLVPAFLIACSTATSSQPEPGPGWEGEWLVEWARPDEWRPFLFSGPLTLRREGRGWTGELKFNQSGAKFTAEQIDVRDDVARLRFATAQGDVVALDLFRDGDVVRGGGVWKRQGGRVSVPWSVVDGGRRWDDLVAEGVRSPWPVVSPAAAAMDEEPLRGLIAEAQRTHSSGFVLVRDGQLVVAVGEDVDAPAHVASVSKALSSLAVPFLIQEGRWPSVDEPIGPAVGWAPDDPRSAITLRHVLSHTTGLEKPDYAAWIEEASEDHRSTVLATKLLHPPGSRFEYNNRAVELTSILVQALTGEALDAYLRPRLLDPLGIEATWAHDDAGHARVHAGVSIDAIDLAKIGVLLMNDGVWEGRRVLPAGWVAAATAQPATGAAQTGLGWFIEEDGSFQHTGDSGAFLLAWPERGIVAARVHRSTRGDEKEREVHRSLSRLMSGVEELTVIPYR